MWYDAISCVVIDIWCGIFSLSSSLGIRAVCSFLLCNVHSRKCNLFRSEQHSPIPKFPRRNEVTKTSWCVRTSWTAHWICCMTSSAGWSTTTGRRCSTGSAAWTRTSRAGSVATTSRYRTPRNYALLPCGRPLVWVSVYGTKWRMQSSLIACLHFLTCIVRIYTVEMRSSAVRSTSLLSQRLWHKMTNARQCR